MLLTLTVIGDSFINQGDCLPGNALNVHVLLQPAAAVMPAATMPIQPGCLTYYTTYQLGTSLEI